MAVTFTCDGCGEVATLGANAKFNRPDGWAEMIVSGRMGDPESDFCPDCAKAAREAQASVEKQALEEMRARFQKAVEDALRDRRARKAISQFERVV